MPGKPSYNPVSISTRANAVTSGGVSQILTTDMSAEQLLLEILLELRKINIQLEMTTGNKIENSDMEV